MKFSEYAKRIGVTRFTVHRWFHDGKIPSAYQLHYSCQSLVYIAVGALNGKQRKLFKV